MQSILLIISQLILLWICLRYTPTSAKAVRRVHVVGDNNDDEIEAALGSTGEEETGSKEMARPFNFWQWPRLGSYIEFLAGLIVVLAILQVALGRFGWYINA